MRVLRARGIESEARVPFAGLLELLRPALGALERIPEPQRAALGERARAAAGDRPGPLRGRRGDAQPARGARGGRAGRRVRRRRPVARRIERGRAAVRDAPARRRPDRRRRRRARGRGVVRRRRAPADAAPRRPRSGSGRRPRRRGGRRPAVRGDGREPARAARARAGGRAPDRPADRRAAADRGQRRAGIPPARRKRCPSRRGSALVVAAASDTGELQTLERARPGLCRGARPGRSSRPRRAARRPGRVQPRPGAVGGLRRRGARGAAVGPSRARRGAAGPRRRPPRLAPRARHRRPGRDRRPRRSSRPATAPTTRSAYAVAAAAYERAATLSAQSRPAALPGRGRGLARRPGRSGDLVARRSASPPTTTSARARDRAPARPDHGAARPGRRGARRSWPPPPSARRSHDPEPAASCSPRRRSSRSTRAMRARCSRTAERATELAAGLEGRAPILAGLAHGMALDLRRRG